MADRINLTRFALLCFMALITGSVRARAARLVSAGTADRHVVQIHIQDGKVTHKDDGTGPFAFEAHGHFPGQDTVTRYNPPLDTALAADAATWLIRSTSDSRFGAAGVHPRACYRKTKVNGHAENQWSGSDYAYQYTFEHYLYLESPLPLADGHAYTIIAHPDAGLDVDSIRFSFDLFHSRTEAIHVNLAGYPANPSRKSADLYLWMGDGGGRDYAAFEGKTVFLYNVKTGQSSPAGAVAFWKDGGPDVGGYSLIRSGVWTADFDHAGEGIYRIAIEGIGCSQDFKIDNAVYREPFRAAVRGFYYMRIGQDSVDGIRPIPRRPLYIPGQDPPGATVYLTTMHPWHEEWQSFASGDAWDKPDDWKRFCKPGMPVNPLARGGHSDALDWDRHLGHVSIVYDMLLPFLLTDGACSGDDIGIAESGNGIPDLLDEARYEVDFWLRLRDGAGYAHGLTNPNDNHELFQAAPTAIAAWANAANAAMLADCFRIAGRERLSREYADSAATAYAFAEALDAPMLDTSLNIGESWIRGRDLKMTAAASLFNCTGDSAFEHDINALSVCAQGGIAVFDDYGNGNSRNQLWATAAYCVSPHQRRYPELYASMKESIIYRARQKEAGMTAQRPSRRATSIHTGYFRTIQNVQRSIIAHAVCDNRDDRRYFHRALLLEAAYGLGRNPLNMIQMTTATTALADRRSVRGAYTSGRNDGAPGLHPGHTPYMNLDDWYCGMTMGCPSRLHAQSYPSNFLSTWPIGEGYFNTRYVWAHNEFTPQQTMRGKMALYGYLYALHAQPNAGARRPAPQAVTARKNSFWITKNRLHAPEPGVYELAIIDARGRMTKSLRRFIDASGLRLPSAHASGVRIISIRGAGARAALREFRIGPGAKRPTGSAR